MPLRPIRPARHAFLLLLALAAGAAPLHAQSGRAPKRTLTVSGEVLDALTGAPVKDAIVRLPDAQRSAATDAQGRFTLRNIPAGTRKWVVGRLGYATWEQELAAEDSAEYTVRILPRPELLEGITVMVDRFETRRRAATTSVRALHRKDILSSASSNAMELVRSRGRFMSLVCPEDNSLRCAYVRGQRVRVGVCIDDVRAPGGLEDLMAYLPQEIYLVEVYGGGSSVRVYTTWYVDHLTRNPQPLPPINYCR